MKRLADYNMTEEEMLWFDEDGRAYFEGLQKWFFDADRVNDDEKNCIALLLLHRGDPAGAREVARTIVSPSYREETLHWLDKHEAETADPRVCVD